MTRGLTGAPPTGMAMAVSMQRIRIAKGSKRRWQDANLHVIATPSTSDLSGAGPAPIPSPIPRPSPIKGFGGSPIRLFCLFG